MLTLSQVAYILDIGTNMRSKAGKSTDLEAESSAW
jgi:hypothetical protein